ncbi:hypothetical protein NGA_0448100 [Nannochloropsis gaditana CCMP526]|nr:hypothetical protein NGA_0448100 [Nannochloropsis gaditana CCMP526]EKU22534.1 hypothetical protein NGA_0448100 [Nannochloropsis gaditana CCMP526]|eukprot:XP_005853824.1 hypothetical protein NGA_0448100 [Nannochloropsis gaditana CCMP526]
MDPLVEGPTVARPSRSVVAAR